MSVEDQRRYLQNPRKRENHYAYIKKRREMRRDWMVEYKESHPCTDCQQFWPWYVMHFDHVRGEKVGDIGTLILGHSMDVIRAEMEKCELVCANCHAIRTHARNDYMKGRVDIATSTESEWSFF